MSEQVPSGGGSGAVEKSPGSMGKGEDVLGDKVERGRPLDHGSAGDAALVIGHDSMRH